MKAAAWHKHARNRKKCAKGSFLGRRICPSGGVLLVRTQERNMCLSREVGAHGMIFSVGLLPLANETLKLARVKTRLLSCASFVDKGPTVTNCRDVRHVVLTCPLLCTWRPEGGCSPDPPAPRTAFAEHFRLQHVGNIPKRASE